MSYRNIKKGFNISDADYHRLPERRKKFYVSNATALIDTARIRPTITPMPQSPAFREPVSRVERDEPDLLDHLVTGLVIGAGIGIAESIFGGDDSISSDTFNSSAPDVEFGGGDFGGAGAGGEW